MSTPIIAFGNLSSADVGLISLMFLVAFLVVAGVVGYGISRAGSRNGGTNYVWIGVGVFVALVFFIIPPLGILAILLGGTAFWIWMLVDCAKRLRAEEKDMIIWLIVLVLTHIIGAAVYFFVVYRGSPTAAIPPIAAAPAAQVNAPPPPPKQAARCPKCGTTLTADAPEGLCPRCLVQMNLAATAQATGASATASSASEPLPSPETIAPNFPQLEILECLGRGGMGVVYKARQPRLDRFVALKILAPGREKDPQFAERFMREARALAKLNHQNIVTVYDFGESGGLYFLLMEYVDGVTLRGMIQGGKLDSAQALSVVPRICEALQYAHEQGVVHRDIKPENVLVDKQGRVKIADFGIARIVGNETGLAGYTKGQAVVGTPYYMAPEQVEKPLSVDHRADIYSLGVVFYEMLTGELPMGRFAVPSEKVQVDVRLDEVVLRALEKDPQRRYQQASHVKTDVEHITGAGGTAAPFAGVKPPVTNAPSGPAPTADTSAALTQVKGPANALRALGIIAAVFAAAGIVFDVVFIANSSDARAGLFVALMCITAIAAALMTAYGAGKMLRLESYATAFTAAIVPIVCAVVVLLAIVRVNMQNTPPMIFLPLLGISLAVGIWSVATLLRPEVRAGFAAVQAGSALSAGVTPPPRLSLTAVVGTAWAGLFFVSSALTWLTLVTMKEFHVDVNNHPPKWIFLSLPILAFALCAPIGTTVLGWIAVGQIRHSDGRLYGLRLAVLNGLFFPLALLDLLIFMPLLTS